MVDKTEGAKPAPDSQEERQKAAGKVKFWLAEVESAMAREDDFRKEGCELVKTFEGGKVDDTPYNILYSNTETILPAVYSATPRPYVRPRFSHGDQTLNAAAAKVCQSLLEFFVDTGDSRYSTFDDLMSSACVESLVPGRGTTRFKYDAEFEKVEGEVAEPEAGGDQAPTEQISYETVCGEEVPWDRILFGFAKKWKDVPWMAIAWPMTREELIDNFGFEMGTKVDLQDSTTSSGTTTKEKGDDKEDKSNTKVAWVYEIWDKIGKKVTFVSPGHKDSVLRETDDPYELSGFFPIPKPLTFVTKIKTLVPVAPYKLYQNQADELNTITRRISRITKALRVRGFYDSTLEDIEDVLEADDNVLLPAKNVAALQQGQTLDRSIWLVPIDQLVGVLQQLYQNREAIKGVIFEVMGIADIMRGSSVASETLGAQQMKAQWGSMRLRNMQKRVMKYSVDAMRIQAEIAFRKLSQETIQSMTGLPYPTEADKAQAQMIVQQVQMQMQQMQQQPQMPPQPGQPPAPQQPPQQPPPAMMEQMAKAQETLAMPSWEQILGELRNDLQRYYKIDIETNSTVDASATEDKSDINELMMSIGQFLSGIAPLIEQGIMPFEAAQAILSAIVRKFRFGYDVEDQLKKMKAPAKQEGGDPKAAAAQAEAQGQAQLMQLKQQTAQQQAQMDQQKAQSDLQATQQANALKMQQNQQDAEFATLQHQQRMADMARKAELALVKHNLSVAQARAKEAQADEAARKAASGDQT